MIDSIDAQLLAALQKDGQATTSALSEKLGLSASQIGRRRQKLESDGLIKGYRARLDAVKLGLSVQAFVHVHLGAHGADTAASFARLLHGRVEITNSWTLTGDADYLLRVFCRDLNALNNLIQNTLLAHPAVAKVHSQIVLDEIKEDGPLPI